MTHSDLKVDPDGAAPIVDPGSDFKLVAAQVLLPELEQHVYTPDTWEGKPQRIQPATPDFLLLKEIRWKVGGIASKEQDAAARELWDEAIAYLDRLIDDRMSRWG